MLTQGQYQTASFVKDALVSSSVSKPPVSSFLVIIGVYIFYSVLYAHDGLVIKTWLHCGCMMFKKVFICLFWLMSKSPPKG